MPAPPTRAIFLIHNQQLAMVAAEVFEGRSLGKGVKKKAPVPPLVSSVANSFRVVLWPHSYRLKLAR